MRSLTVLAFTAVLIASLAIAQRIQRQSDYDAEPSAESAAPAFPAQLAVELAKLRDEALQDEYAHQQLAHLTENIGPRPVGSPQAAAAVQYVAGELRRLGLEVRLEEVNAPHWLRGAETAELVE
jgi:carboxypeptidase Q